MRKIGNFDVTMALDLYAPYVSGLTETARIVAEGLAGRGWRVAVACARHDGSLPRHELMNGVHVFRAPVYGRAGRGLITPGLPWLAVRLARRSRLLHMHLPMPEAAPIAWLTRRVPLVTTYQIDAYVPPGLLNGVGRRAVDLSASAAIRRADLVIVNNHDQARGSRIWPRLRRRVLRPIASACVDRGGGVPSMRDGSGLHLGFMGRIHEEKGIEYLIRAFRQIDDPKARLLIAGDYENVAGGSNIELLRAEAAGDQRIRFLGLLRGGEIDDFYASIDVFVLPSISESFGIVQAEAMMTGVPSVTTDLPGSRQPVQVTGFGRLVPPRDPRALRAAIFELAELSPAQRERGRAKALELWGGNACLDAHQDAYESLVGRK
ncbi:MAG TPA: glycosyltransferase family 4 protein [Streptosporangiaceae bacterium]